MKAIDERFELGKHTDHTRDVSDWDYAKRLRYQTGDHVGKGPKNYVRSDNRILEEVCEILTSHPMVDATEIIVSVDNGFVILKGRVGDRAQKKEAERSIENVLGVKDVLNYLTLRPDRGLIGDSNIKLNML